MNLRTISSSPILVGLLAASFSFVAASALHAAAPGTTPPTQATTASEAVHPLLWARSVTAGEFSEIGEDELFLAARWLEYWSKFGDKVPVTGNTEQYLAALEKSKQMYSHLHAQYPQKPKYVVSIASANYNIGELLPPDNKDRRMELYSEMVDLTKMCVEELDPNQGRCWMLLGVGYGRLGTTRGVLSSAFLANDVEDAWLKSLEINSPEISFIGDPITVDTMLGLSVFYRIVPDHWLVKVVTGTRGDKEKSVSTLRKLVAMQPNRLELQKEFAVSLLCYGDDEDDQAAIEEARDVLQRIRAGAFDAKDVRATDAIDKAHAKELLERPPRDACGYSRDGFQDLSDDALKKARDEHTE